MIKRLGYATRNPAIDSGEWPGRWADAVAEIAAQVPVEARPVRVAVSIALPEMNADPPRHDGISAEWFRDDAHLDRFRRWLQSPAADVPRERLNGLLVVAASPVAVAEELVLRGAPWLEQRWRDGGARVKHVAIARRAPGLSAAEFSRRWRGHAGQLRSSAAAAPMAIPADVRGCAYVQNHPRPRDHENRAYDALNEVYFDDLCGLARRVEWFRDNPPAADGLFGESWLLACQEQLLVE